MSKLYIWIVCLSSIGMSCTTASSRSDEIVIEQPAVVFYSINENEYKVRAEEEGIDEVLSDFGYYAAEFEKTIDSEQIDVIKSHSKNYSFILKNGKSVAVKIDIDKHIVATIFFNSNEEPRIEYGVLTDVDYENIVGELFSTK